MARELRAFMGLYGIQGRMPTTAELQTRGANSLYIAIAKHGGFGALAQRLGVPTQRCASHLLISIAAS